MRNAADEYLYTQVMTAPAERLHLMVIDAALRFARQGADALRNGDFEMSFAALNRSRACVQEMVMAVNSEPNPELASQFKSLLAFVYRNLALADHHHDVVRVEDAVRILEIHRETWLELLETVTPQAAPAPQRAPTVAPVQPRSREYDEPGSSQLSLVG